MAMTAQQVADWMRAQGVDENVIRDEAATIATRYATIGPSNPHEGVTSLYGILDRALPGYLQRSRGGRDYSTDLPDPAVTVRGAETGDTVTAPVRPAHTEYAPPVIVMAGPGPLDYASSLTLPAPAVLHATTTTNRSSSLRSMATLGLMAIGAWYGMMKGK
jgi:hypothetical protein